VVAAVFVAGAAVFVAGAAVFVAGAAVDVVAGFAAVDVVGVPAANAGPDDAIATRGKRRIAVPVRTAFSKSERVFMRSFLLDAAHTAARR
jgi:hypothetical protein